MAPSVFMLILVMWLLSCLQVAAKLNGTDMNGDGLPDYALCFDVDASKHFELFRPVTVGLS